MNFKSGSGSCVALAAMFAMFGAATEASAQQSYCSKAELWASPSAGSNSALPVSSRYDVLFDLMGGTGVDLQPRNGGAFDAYFCNPSPYNGSYFIRYAEGGQENSVAPAQTCFQLRNIKNLVIQGSSSWRTCILVRYRD